MHDIIVAYKNTIKYHFFKFLKRFVQSMNVTLVKTDITEHIYNKRSQIYPQTFIDKFIFIMLSIQ